MFERFLIVLIAYCMFCLLVFVLAIALRRPARPHDIMRRAVDAPPLPRIVRRHVPTVMGDRGL